MFLIGIPPSREFYLRDRLTVCDRNPATMTDQSSSHATSYEIVCLEHQGSYLYAEVIQTIETRQRSWVRPLFLQLTTQSSEPAYPAQGLFSFRLQNCADLVWPSQFFRPAMDDEVLPFLLQMHTEKPQDQEDPKVVSERDRKAHQALRQMIQQVWQAFPDAFASE
ncbi:conserved hypothetical protein [Acaryochloris marina MBIC11017]|uniref:Uncharacterized protein n=1 Tax=Acaryochloris marina (strain MBIC 11017) TaxID=329726 RepID=B0C5S2_ACAM1|nr:conserved hypothetical protein [Acaryochloris marina MBIC11017]